MICCAQSATPIRIDASTPYSEPAPAPYDSGTAMTPSGRILGVNSRYLTLDGKPWLPVMGEFHYSRYPREAWESEILKMKAAGVNIVAAYVIWIHHEEIRGQFDWNGQRGLRAFAELCAKHGMLMVARIGPWDHGEVRNGGFPDWVLQQGPTRENDPVYLASVRAWYGQIGAQLKGLLWKDGGPVIGVQLENEYAKRGPGAGEAHILELKKIAIESGLDVPLYLVTGWDNAVIPPRAVVPVYGGGYPDAPWDSAISKLPPQEVYAFRFHSRAKSNVQSTGCPAEVEEQPVAQDQLPYLTAEIGGGIEDTYHRRPVIAPDDIGAMFPVMLGSGANVYGTYMFQGGENPDGKLSTLQESQDTGYPNDLPIKSYDFQAPLSEFGQERASFRKLKVFQYFLNDFGAELAPMAVYAPDHLPRSCADFSTPRAAVRSNGDSGFIFFNNYVRGYAMPARPATQFLVQLPGSSIAVPRHPMDLPSGAYFIWPLNLHLGDIRLRYSTAQVVTRIKTGDITTIYFEAIPGVPVEFAFDAHSVSELHPLRGKTEKTASTIYVNAIQPGPEARIDVVSNSGARVRVVVLTAEEAEEAWKAKIDGAEHLLLTKQDYSADPDVDPGQILLTSAGSPHFAFTVIPPLANTPQSSLPLKQVLQGDTFESFAAEATAHDVQFTCHPIRAAGYAPPVKLGPALDWRPVGVAQAPPATGLSAAARWEITIPADALDGLNELYLQVNYQGDLARLTANQKLLDDNFFNGQPWMIGLKRFLVPHMPNRFELSILPLRKDAPIYLELPVAPSFGSHGQAMKLDRVKLMPEYLLELTDHEQAAGTQPLH